MISSLRITVDQVYCVIFGDKHMQWFIRCDTTRFKSLFRLQGIQTCIYFKLFTFTVCFYIHFM